MRCVGEPEAKPARVESRVPAPRGFELVGNILENPQVGLVLGKAATTPRENTSVPPAVGSHLRINGPHEHVAVLRARCGTCILTERRAKLVRRKRQRLLE